MTTFPVPEILRTPLESLVVQAKIHSPTASGGSLQAVDFLSQVLDSPEREAVTDAVRNLQEIGVLDKTEALTPLGERVACLSCDPRLGKVLVLAALFRCVLPLLSVTACLTRDPFTTACRTEPWSLRLRKTWEVQATVITWCSVEPCWAGGVFSKRGTERPDRDYLNRYTLSGAGLRFINGLTSQFSENLP
ncbi:ATP-dependent RNA helicase DHX30-like [Oncorhynchus kisutch]|uniref:ATP-dependent RNA helicase DHX30-like n=1 Tax=Oncorhynchus kisutch TaxID=8019 RepID=UPI0012DC4BC5|nr:ATP-dependent RNA helicase DHX30-like [Oncorhynchus kisutch]